MSSNLPETSARREPENLAILLREPFDLMTRLLYQRLAQRGHGRFRIAHGAVFQYLDDSGTRIGVLADRAGISKQAMAELVAHLDRIGYVKRGPDPSDKRASLITATEKGAEVFAVARELMAEIEDHASSVLGKGRYAEMRSSLGELVSVLEGFSASPSSVQGKSGPISSA